MDKSIELFPIKNILEIAQYNNQIDVSIVKVETLFHFVTPAQVVVQRIEVG